MDVCPLSSAFYCQHRANYGAWKFDILQMVVHTLLYFPHVGEWQINDAERPLLGGTTNQTKQTYSLVYVPIVREWQTKRNVLVSRSVRACGAAIETTV